MDGSLGNIANNSGMGDFPRSARTRRTVPNSAPARGNNSLGSAGSGVGLGTGLVAGTAIGATAGGQSYLGDQNDVIYEQGYVSTSGNYGGGAHSEKVKAKFKEEASASYSDEVKSNDGKHHGDHHRSSGWGAWIIWIIIIFIFILFIVMGCFWFFRPDCVTRDCDDDGDGIGKGDDCGRDLDIGCAAIYAFVITFFLVFIIFGIWWCVACR